MKWLYSLLVLSCLSFLSCSKDNDSGNPEYYIQATVNGQRVTFNVNAVGGWEIGAGTLSLYIAGYEKAAGDSRSLGILIDNAPSGMGIGAGAYNDSGVDFDILSSYFVPAESKNYIAGTELSAAAELEGISLQNRLEVIVTSLSDNIAQGSFSGDHYLDADPAAAKVTITDGSFRVPIR